MVHFSLLVHLLDAPIKDVFTFFGTFTLHEPLRLFLPEGNENDGVRLSSFSITTDSGELHGQDKERLDSSKVCACFPSIVF